MKQIIFDKSSSVHLFQIPEGGGAQWASRPKLRKKLVLLKIGLEVPPMAQKPGIFAYFENMYLKVTLKDYCRL